MSGDAPVFVRIDGAAEIRERIAATLASLPLSFCVRPDGDVVALDGAADWPRRAIAAITAGAAAVFVSDPAPASDVEGLCVAAERAGTALRLGRGWRDDPAVDGFATTVAGLTDAVVLADAHAVVPRASSLRDTLAAQLDVAARALGRHVRITRISATADAYSASGYIGRPETPAPLVLSAVRSQVSDASIRIRRLSHRGRAALHLYGGRSARPALAVIGDEGAERLLPTIYETGHRAAWRALRADLRLGRVDTGAVREFGVASEHADDLLNHTGRTPETNEGENPK